MRSLWNLLMLVGHLSLVAAQSPKQSECPLGLKREEQINGHCVDEDECAIYKDYPDECGNNAICINTYGSFYCTCEDGYRTALGNQNFSGWAETICVDENECQTNEPDEVGPCGQNAYCINTIGSFYCTCEDGYRTATGNLKFSAASETVCVDIDECQENTGLCNEDASCINASPLYNCFCNQGFRSSNGAEAFRQGDGVTCVDEDECMDHHDCGGNATCTKTRGSYYCTCNPGFGLRSGRSTFTGTGEQCEDICSIDETICGNGTCHSKPGGHLCACHKGFTNYGNQQAKCIPLDCDVFNMDDEQQVSPETHDFTLLLKQSCQKLSEAGFSDRVDGYDILMRLLSIADALLFSGLLGINTKVSAFLAMMENALGLVSPLVTPPGVQSSSNLAELDVRVHRGAFPNGPVTISSDKVKLDIDMKMAAGSISSYAGFATVSMLTFSKLEKSAFGYFSEMEGRTFKINSKIVTVSVSNRNTRHLDQPIMLTFDHLVQSAKWNHTCVFWDSSEDGGSWSPRGCSVVESSSNQTLCSCNHLGSFAVLMSLYEMEDMFDPHLIAWVGLSISLVCLFLCILTFSLIRSIKSPRTTIHLHLSISLFVATLILLVNLYRTENKVGCTVVASLLHFFFLAAFCWMCLEGVQLFRMVVLVFNTNFKTLYMMALGYGVPAVIVAITLSVNVNNYSKLCWLSPNSIWSFYGPVCVILIINVFFFIITLWKLAQKLTSLNPDFDKLQKIKSYTITAVAELLVVSLTWKFECLRFIDNTTIMVYLFIIFASLQGLMMFVFHCLLSKQVREEYGNILSRLCAPRRTQSHSSKRGSKSTQDTGESHV